MTFVTSLELTSGDRTALEAVVTDIKETAERKGVALKGPHSRPPAEYRVPLSRRLHGGDETVGTWDYTVYRREIEIHGHESFAGSVATRDVPDSIRIEATVERLHGPGN